MRQVAGTSPNSAPRYKDTSGDDVRVRRAIVSQTDGYSRAVHGVDIQAIRIGNGLGPNRVQAVEHPDFVGTSSAIGIPMSTSTTVGDGSVVVVRIDRAESRSRWCGFDLEPGMVIVYAPGAEHTATNRPGLQFTFIATTVDQINHVADRLRTAVRLPRRGRVEVVNRPHAVAIDRAFPRLAASMRTAKALPRPIGQDILASTVQSLAHDERLLEVGGGGGIDSRAIVRRCIEYADSSQRIPSIGELCFVAHVSERRLRQAFTDQFDMPPTKFFRNWALALAHRRLRAGEVDTTTVTRIALDIGFHHLGRFSTYYRTVYGEAPSSTLRATALSARVK